MPRLTVLGFVLLGLVLAPPAAAQRPDRAGGADRSSPCGGSALGVPQPSPGAAEHDAVRAVIDRLFDAMRAGDSTAVRATFAPQMRLMTVAAGDDSTVTVQEMPSERFAAAVGAARGDVG